MHKIEGIVIKWTHQVKSVLELKSNEAIKDGKNPGPQEELKFWSELTSNLQCIYDQEHYSFLFSGRRPDSESPETQAMAKLPPKGTDLYNVEDHR